MLFYKDNENAGVKRRNKQKRGETETDGTTTQASCKCPYRLMTNSLRRKARGQQAEEGKKRA